MTQARDTVEALLRDAGLQLRFDEVEALAETYPSLRASVDRLYEVASLEERPATPR